jgi:DNA polymerase V
VIAGINGQKTVKRLSINGDSVRLMPENKNYQPIVVKTIDELSIWGVVSYRRQPTALIIAS